jgi:hypothetical protein
MRKRDWVQAAALVPYVVVMLPISTVLAVGILAFGVLTPRRRAQKCRIHANSQKVVQFVPPRCLILYNNQKVKSSNAYCGRL